MTEVALRRWFERPVGGSWGETAGEGDRDALCIRGTDLVFGQLAVDETTAPLRGFSNADVHRRSLMPGDIVIEKSGGGDTQPVGRVGLYRSSQVAVPTNFAARLRPRSHVDPRFACYELASLYFAGRTMAAVKQTTGIQNLDLDELLTNQAWLPPLAEQRAIADYLDAETTRIDALIAKKQQLIHLLEERRLAAIDDAVSSARGPTVAVRRLSSRITSGPRGWASYVSDTGTPFIRITNIQRNRVDLDMSDTLLVDAPESPESIRTRVRTGDVLVSITADIGSVGCVPPELDGSNISQHVALVRPANCEPEWLAYAIRSTPARVQLDSGQYGGTKTQLSLDDIASLRVRYPEKVAQRRTVDRLRRSLDAIDSCGSRLRTQLGLLSEHRQALITTAVSGEFAVPRAS